MNIYTLTLKSVINVLIPVFLFLSTQVTAQQMEVTGGDVLPYTPKNLITNTFLGDGVVVTDIQYDGVDKAVGFFSGGQASIGIDRGIILSTGVASKVSRTGRDGAQDNSDLNQEFQSETDLQRVAGGADLRNVAKYTIKFIPTADTLRFRYVFASEEYPEFVCSPFNDVFGFFISGPGISGGYENGGENIAKIPGTNFPVSINHVNGGASGVWGTPGNCTEPQGSLNFSHLFNDNQNSNFQPVYDGFTNVFTAQAVVVPCQEYTIKLTIADVTDEGYDSGVFLEAKSFGTQQISLSADTYSPDGAVTEGCTDGSVKFNLSEVQATDYSINYSVFGTAENGVDFENLSGTLTIPAGQTEAVLTIHAFEDNVLEPTEVVYIDVERDMCTRDTVAVFIKDNALVAPVLPNPEICPDNSITLDGTIMSSVSPGLEFESTQLVAITPYNTTIASDLTVSNVFPPNLKEGIIESVCIEIDHNNPEDIEAWIVAPNGDFMLLTSDNGVGGMDYEKTCFSPDATTTIQSSSAPFTGSFSPEGKWENLIDNGGETNGTWQLMVRDDELGSTGILRGWSITFKPGYSLDFEWSGGDGIDCIDCPLTDILPSQSATYQMAITDSYGCVVTADSDVKVLNKEAAPILNCDTATFNSVVFEWDEVQGISNYEINLNGSGWTSLDASETNFEVNNLGLDEQVDFEIRVISDCLGEIGTGSCRTLNCTPPIVDFLVTKEVSCFENADAEIELSVPGSTTTYDFELEGETNQTGIFTGLKAGNYNAIVTDALGCFSEFPFEITEPNRLTLQTNITDAISCFRTENGSATAIPSGGMAPYSFVWNTGDISANLTQVGEGNYLVTVTDANDCQADANVTFVQPEELTGDMTENKVSCNGAADGNATFSPKGGTLPYSIVWDNGTAGQTISGLSEGTFNVQVTDANDCILDAVAEITENEAIVIETTVTSPDCNSGANGSATVLATGGAGDFTYEWSTGATGDLAEDLRAGNYQVIAIDSDKCKVSTDLTITDRAALDAIVMENAATCAEKNDGTARIEILGGTPNYQILWWDGNTSLERTDLAAGDYTLQVSDSLNCTIDKTVSIAAPEEITLDFAAFDPQCYKTSTGHIELTVSGGTGDFQYDWGNGNGFTAQPILGGLEAGDYSVVIKDENDCTISQDFNLVEPEAIGVEANVKNVTCHGKRNGEITAFLTGGTGNYAMAWTNNEGSLGSDKKIEFLTAGSYELYANDANGCIITKTFDIIEPAKLEAIHEAFPISCTNRKDGEIFLEIDGGTLPYEVYLNGSKRGDIEQISNLKVGEYLVSIQDANNCTFESEAILVDTEHAFEVQLGKDTLVKYGTVLSIEPKLVNSYEVTEFDWTSTAQENLTCTDCPQTEVIAKSAATVYLKVKDEKGCVAENRMNIFIQKDFKVLVPTGFTPNGDGNNDRLLVHGTEGTLVKTFKIFDRWGELVFESGDFLVNDPSAGWDGVFRGKNMNTGVFIWYAETVNEDGSSDFSNGETTLIR